MKLIKLLYALSFLYPAIELTMPEASFAQTMMGPSMGRMQSAHPCPMMSQVPSPMLPKEGKIKVDNTKDGVNLSITSSDPKEVIRIQKRYEILKLMHELEETYE